MKNNFDFKIEIINPEEVKELFYHWGRFASKCYDTPEGREVGVGKHCLESGHFSGSRSRYIEIDVSNVPRAMIDQIIRKEQGCVKNVESGRYVDFSDFEYFTPPVIERIPAAKEIYDSHMEMTRKNYSDIVNVLNENGITGEKAFESARGISPMNYNTGMVIGFTIESLIDMCHKRLCVRAQDHSRMFIKKIKDEVIKLIPEMKEHLVIQCEYLLWCPEKKTCGLFPKKEDLKLILKNNKK